eukprot:CAMPEP_0178439688 /NCGR_PEP_ID=MMETSP0689_2-20121128/36307_1 /TAXON_ID=160604 /ORGANISM="Amphidinium massartii, Strain CS-259" /LENGTH=773 /DNA_ID=CAMNT_0020062269 /DNA_START=14 /DNA_END=2332 /DNA_ORIENTATION=+
MEFIVAAASGTHIYRSLDEKKSTLIQTLPPPRPGLTHCIELNECRSCLAVVLSKGSVGVWQLGGSSTAPPQAADANCISPVCEIPGQSTPVARCYFSPKGSCIAAWEPVGTFSRVEQRGKTEAQRKAFTNAQNLIIWALHERGPVGQEFSVEIEKDGKQKLGVNVDHEEGRNGLLVRRVDPGLVFEHNSKAEASSAIAAGDRIISVNGKEWVAQAMAEEIQKAPRLLLRVRRSRLWHAKVIGRFFAPSTNPLRWPPLSWSASEKYAFRCVTNEILVLDGTSLAQMRRLPVDNVLQMSVAPSALEMPDATALAVFCPGSTSASPSMVRVFSNIEVNDPGCGEPRPNITKSFFSDVAWVTTRWEPACAKDLFVLVHSSELTDADVEGRTLHGQGGNGLYLIRTENAAEPIFSLSGFQDGVIFDAQWCPVPSGNLRRLVLLQGPQPALVSVVTYKTSGGSPERVDIGRFGVRNCVRWDTFGSSFCLRALSLGGAGVSNEAETIDLFEAAGEVQWRASASAGGRREKEQTFGVGLCVQSVDFSPDGKILMVSVGGQITTEVKFVSATDGSVLQRLKFDEVYQASWRPVPSGLLHPPEFPPPPSEEVRAELLAGRMQVPVTVSASILANRDCREENGFPAEQNDGDQQRRKQAPIPGAEPEKAFAPPKRKGPAPKAVNMEDKESVSRRVRALQKKLRDIERLGSLPESSLDSLQREKLATEAEVRQQLAHLEKELDLLEREPILVFDVRTESGMQHIKYREGDDCMMLAAEFCQEHHM